MSIGQDAPMDVQIPPAGDRRGRRVEIATLGMHAGVDQQRPGDSRRKAIEPSVTIRLGGAEVCDRPPDGGGELGSQGDVLYAANQIQPFGYGVVDAAEPESGTQAQVGVGRELGRKARGEGIDGGGRLVEILLEDLKRGA